MDVQGSYISRKEMSESQSKIDGEVNLDDLQEYNADDVKEMIDADNLTSNVYLSFLKPDKEDQCKNQKKEVVKVGNIPHGCLLSRERLKHKLCSVTEESTEMILQTEQARQHSISKSTDTRYRYLALPRSLRWQTETMASPEVDQTGQGEEQTQKTTETMASPEVYQKGQGEEQSQKTTETMASPEVNQQGKGKEQNQKTGKDSEKIQFDENHLREQLKPYITKTMASTEVDENGQGKEQKQKTKIRLESKYQQLYQAVRHCLSTCDIVNDNADITLILTKKKTRIEVDARCALQEADIAQDEKDKTILVMFHFVCGSYSKEDVEAVMYRNDLVVGTIHVPFKTKKNSNSWKDRKWLSK